MRGVVVQVEHGDAINYLAELAAMGPYRFSQRAPDRHPQGLLSCSRSPSSRA